MTEETQVTLTRDGKPPLKFTATARWQADDQTHQTTRWTVTTIYRTKGGRLVASRVHRTQWEGEHDSHEAESFGSARELIDWLSAAGGLSHVAQEALESAAESDEEFRNAYQEEIP